MNLKLEFEFSKADILKEVAALKKQIDNMRPLPPDIEGKVMQKLRLDWNYNSNAIEGNKLSYGETVAFLMEGITAKGKPLKDHLDIRGHNEAINFLLEIVKDSRPLSEADIRSLHEMILVEPYDSPAKTADGQPTSKRITLGEYKTSPNHVKTATGETHYYATPEETPAKMQELMEWYEEVERYEEISPIVIAALFHHKFVEIHPFDDGNGRLSRILMNLILMKNDYPPVVIKMDDRKNYYSLLSRADRGDSWPFVEYIAEQLKGSLELYLKAANGDDIDEDEDINKDIALFKLELQNSIDLTDKKSGLATNRVIREEIIPLFQKILDTSKSFDDLFFTNNKFSRYRFHNDINASQSRYDFKDNQVNGSTTVLNEYDKIEFYCYYKEFKNAKNIFNIDLQFNVVFDTYKYLVFDFKNKEIISHFYHKKITKSEQQLVIKSFVSTLKDRIKQNLEQKSSKP